MYLIMEESILHNNNNSTLKNLSMKGLKSIDKIIMTIIFTYRLQLRFLINLFYEFIEGHNTEYFFCFVVVEREFYKQKTSLLY